MNKTFAIVISIILGAFVGALFATYNPKDTRYASPESTEFNEGVPCDISIAPGHDEDMALLCYGEWGKEVGFPLRASDEQTSSEKLRTSATNFMIGFAGTLAMTWVSSKVVKIVTRKSS